VSQEVVQVLVNTVHRLTFSQLLDTEESELWLSSESKFYQLHISRAEEHQKHGGFKVASPAHLDSTTMSSTVFMKHLPKGLRKSLYAKQVFYRPKSLTTSTAAITRYLGPSAVARIEMELKCIIWAQALLQLAYDYIKKFDDVNGPPPPHLINLPQFRFVHAALAVEQGKPSRDARAFLLEEEIDEEMEGKFRKYFNNTSPVPCQFIENITANILRADFLAFTQHLQFWKTGKLVFVADYQGMPITVPPTLSIFSSFSCRWQYITYGPSNHHTSKVWISSLSVVSVYSNSIVISNSIGEGVFASGNLSKNWETFERLHQCTQWCEYYQLPRDYDESDRADTNLQRMLVRDLKAPEHASYQPHPISPQKPNAMSVGYLLL
jgi:hypothetical protein